VAALPTLVPAVGSAPFERFVVNLAWVNVVWSLINLMLPVWPLDGGKLFHLALRQFTSTERARNLALKISIMTTIGAGLLAVAVLQTFPIFVAIISFFIVVSNLQKLRGGAPLVQRSADGTREAAEANDEGTAPPLLDEAQQALERGDWSEAYRLTHQLRSSTRNLGSQTLDEIWTILSVAATKLGKYDEASTYVDRAPANARVQNARRELEHRRDDDR
ncbi:MAG: site-2 protease family protein, partial [Bradymonadaceae bacterium]